MRSLIAGAMALALLGAEGARADETAERYVAQNAAQAIKVLDAAAPGKERSAKFAALMDQFADLPAIAEFVLGAYARPLRTDPALKAEWNAAYRSYAMASYEQNFGDLHGSLVRVTGSRDSQMNGRSCSRVSSTMTMASSTPQQFYWYLCRAASDVDWKVTDVSMVAGDSEIKLAITQRDQFVAFLGANGGDVRKLIARLNAQVTTMGKRPSHSKRA